MNGEWGRSALHSVEALVGIGPKLTQQLADIGIGTIEEIASLEASTLGGVAAVVDGVSEYQLTTELIPQAWFHLLGEDGGLAASRLVEAGITNYVELVAVQTSRVVNLLGARWDCDRAAQLQLSGARANMCFTVLLRVIDADGNPILPQLQVAGAGFDPGRGIVTHVGDENGWVLSPRLRVNRRHHLSIVTEGGRWGICVRAGTTPVTRLTVRLAGTFSRGMDEATLPERPRLLTGRETVILESMQSSDLPAGTPMRIVKIEHDRAILLGLFRQFLWNSVVTARVDIEAALLPTGAHAGDIVVLSDQRVFRQANQDEHQRVQTIRGANFAWRKR